MAMKKCPVCGEEITGKGVTVKAQGLELMACCESCAAKIRENPTAYNLAPH